MNKSIKKFTSILLIIIPLFFLYVFRLQNYPPSIHCDEIIPALTGRSILPEILSKLIGVSWFDIPNLVFIPYGLINHILGNSIFSARLPSAIIGILSVVTFFFLVKMLFKQSVAIIASILLATSHWWIASARSGIINIQTVPPAILAFYFLFKGIKENNNYYFFITGFFTSLGLYLYLNSRIIPLIILAVFIYEFISKKKKKIILKNFFIWLLSAFIFFLPMFIFYLGTPQSFLSRSSIAFIFSSDPSVEKHMVSVYGTPDRRIWLLNNVEKAFDVSKKFKDSNMQYGYVGRPFDLLTLALFLIGQILLLVKIKNVKAYFVLLWFWLTYIVLGILTVNIALPRLVGLLPVMYIFPAIAIDRLVDLIFNIKRHLKLFKYAFIVIILAVIVFTNIKIYFVDNSKDGLEIFNKNVNMKLAEYFLADNYTHRVIFVTEPYILSDWCLFSLVTPALNPLSIKDGDRVPEINEPKLFIIQENYTDMLEKIRNVYPSGTLKRFENLYMYTLDNQ